MSLWKRTETFERATTGPTRVVGVPPLSELVSCGWTEYTTSDRDPRTGATVVRTTDYRVLYHRRHPARRFVQWRNGPVEPLEHRTGGDDSTTPLGVVRGAGFTSGRWPQAEPDRVAAVE